MSVIRSDTLVPLRRQILWLFMKMRIVSLKVSVKNNQQINTYDNDNQLGSKNSANKPEHNHPSSQNDTLSLSSSSP